MRRPAPKLWLYLAARIGCYVVLANAALMAPLLLAKQAREIRLFHEHMNITVADEQTINSNRSQATLSESSQVGSQTDIQKPELKQNDTAAPSTDIPDAGENSTYQYNGFISTASGKHYLINGLPLSGIDSLALVSVKLGGKSLVLKTSNGHTFELTVGQTISKESM